MNISETFTAPISSSAHRLAEQFRRQQSDSLKAKQVYLNTLAASAVNFYLRCMGIETDWQSSDSFDPIAQTLMNVASLSVKGRGKLECLPVLPDSQVVQLPPETWTERIGYVAVQFEPSLTRATLLGFTPSAPASGELAITRLKPLDDLLEHLCPAQNLNKVNIGQWLDNIFAAGWQSLEELFGTQDLAYTFRSVLGGREAEIKRAKQLNLGVQLREQSVALLVAIAPLGNQIAINVQVHPIKEDRLPADLKLDLLSDAGEPLGTVRARDRDNYIQLPRFRGVSGESFNIQVSLGSDSVTETFII